VQKVFVLIPTIWSLPDLIRLLMACVELSLLAQTLDNCMQIKDEAPRHRKKNFKQVVSSGTPRRFHKFLSWF